MLFGGRVERSAECWRGNPFNSANNSNRIDGDSDGDGAGDTQQLPLPAGVDAIQKAYIRKVIDTVNAFDNVLFEVSNESTSNSAMWQYDIVNYIKEYEAGSIDGVVRNRHPVGMTAFYDTMNNLLLSGPADWISPGGGPSDPYFDDPPAADGSKVSILDSDHVFFNEVFDKPLAGTNWVWKSFMRGHNPILMENIFVDSTGRAFNVTVDDPGYKAARIAMGQTRGYAKRINLARMVPHGELTSTRYALANPGFEYLVYQPNSQGNPIAIDLTPGTYSYEWLEPASGKVFTGQITTKGGPTNMIPPFSSDAVLYLVNLIEAQSRAANHWTSAHPLAKVPSP
jgi:hypothetical protein